MVMWCSQKRKIVFFLEFKESSYGYSRFTKDYKPRSSGYTAFGDKISINYQTYGRATKGFKVDFVCTSKDAPTPQPATPKTTSTPKTAGTQSTFSTPVITTQKVITTTKGSSQNYVPISLIAALHFLA
ncbi:hypothetical protein CAEBREN_24754 [Caenorhabditis brenneri]|uniref:Uncharacterized protein n=1 Tax=Caenorhabditis brenneri TaxID=135651 RepID=G0PKZ8_CAEBE|nr:hypothetical protein CAEBREN_24754 [Caenorhabditis brenneri]